MKVKNLNASSRKTKDLIRKTFAELMNEKKELQKVTVTELVNRADITRGTFYTHYDNIYDVARDIQDELIDILMINTTELNSLNDINHYFDKVFDHLKENELIYSMFLSSDEPLLFTNRLNKIMSKKVYDYLNVTHQKNLYLNVAFFIDGCINLVIKYFRHEVDTTLDDICDCIKILFNKIFN